METKQRLNNSTTIREYDKGGYHVIEMNSPNKNVILKYNNKNAQVCYNQEIIYDGVNTQNFRKQLGSLDTLLSSTDFEEFLEQALEELDYKLDVFDTILDSKMNKLDDMLDSFDTNSRTYSQTNHNNLNNSNLNRTHSTRTSYSVSKRKSGCLGCLIWAIFIMLFISIILYGLEQLGGMIINWIFGLF